jgi:hypothetical protein
MPLHLSAAALATESSMPSSSTWDTLVLMSVPALLLALVLEPSMFMLVVCWLPGWLVLVPVVLLALAPVAMATW